MEPTVLPVQENINITISLQEIKCTLFSFTEYAQQNKTEIPFDRFEFVLTINFTVVEATKQCSIALLSKLNEKKSDSVKFEIAKLNATLLFSIVNYDELITKNEELNNFNIKTPVIELCNSIAISSARGMYSVKLENSIYSNAVLPLIDVKTLKLTPQVVVSDNQ